MLLLLLSLGSQGVFTWTGPTAARTVLVEAEYRRLVIV